MKNNKIIKWFIKHSLTIASCVLIVGLGIAFLAWSSPGTTTIGEDVSVSGTISEGGTLLSNKYLGIPPSSTWGDLLFRGETVWTRLGAGTSGQFLKTSGAGVDPAWDTALTTYARAATKVVCANDSTDTTNCDYICTGANDQVQINAALNALSASGGRVVLSEGTFTIDDPITFPANNLTLEGQGRSTFIDGDGLATNEHGIVISGRTSCAVKNLAIQTEDGSGKTCHCIFVEDGSDYASIENVVVVASDSDGIRIEGTATNNARIHRCTIEGVDDNGICNHTSAVANRLHISECTIISPGNHGIAVGLTNRGATNFEITGNLIHSPGADGIHTRICDSGSISNNTIYEPSNYGIYMWAVWTAVTGNSIYSPGNYGIYVYNVENTISGNLIYSPTAGGGIHLTSDADKTVVTGNTITLVTGDNIIFIDGAENVNIVGNVLDGSSVAKGIYVAGPYANVSGNFVCGETAGILDDAISVASGGDYANIAGNLIHAAWKCCILIGDGATHINITGNYCYDAHTDGIKLEANNTDCNIVGNLCYGNSDYGINIAAATCSKNVITANHLSGNTDGAILDSGTLTTVGDDNEGITITDIKMYRTLKNTSGGALAAGDVVILKAGAAGNETTTTTSTGDDKVYGMVAETIADNASGYVLVEGKTTALKVSGEAAGGDIAIGDLLGTHDAAGISQKAAAGNMAFAIALEAYAGDDHNGVIDALLITPRKL